MKKILLIIAFLSVSVFSFNSFARGTIVTDSLYSKALNYTITFNVYLPDGYAKSEKSYPVIYLLHGLYGSYPDWVKSGNMKAVADELMEYGEVREAIIFMPQAGDYDVNKVQNGYFNVKDWPYEDFFFGEFIPTVEGKYRCIADKGHRAIMGLSMGGGGSTVYAQRHPEMFSSCYAMSAWLDEDESDKRLEKGDKLSIVVASVIEHSALDFIDNASPETLEALRTVKWFFDCGDDDSLMKLSVDLHLKMKAAKVKSDLLIRNGTHSWEYWHTALRVSLPFASRNFEK